MSDLDTILPDYASIQLCLDKLSATTDCAEAHGSLCGILLDNRDSKEWLSSILNKTPASNDILATEHINELIGLYNCSKQQLNDSVLSFNLLLPSDDIDIRSRLESLSHWCQGFLYGIGSIDKIDEKNMLPDVREFMTDLLSITQVELKEEESEESEQSLVEIIEYVRMGVIYLNEILNPVLNNPEPNSRKH